MEAAVSRITGGAQEVAIGGAAGSSNRWSWLHRTARVRTCSGARAVL